MQSTVFSFGSIDGNKAIQFIPNEIASFASIIRLSIESRKTPSIVGIFSFTFLPSQTNKGQIKSEI